MKHPLAQNAGLVITSPMRRTIQTALGSVDWLLAKGVRLQAAADWQGKSIPRKSVLQDSWVNLRGWLAFRGLFGRHGKSVPSSLSCHAHQFSRLY